MEVYRFKWRQEWGLDNRARLVVPTITTLILGCQTLLGSFFLSILQLARR